MDRLSPYGGEMGMTRKARREVGATRRARHDGGLRAAWLTKVKRGESDHVPLRMVREARGGFELETKQMYRGIEDG